jgi:hypothetical protein
LLFIPAPQKKESLLNKSVTLSLKKGNGVSAAEAREMILFKHAVKEITQGPLADFLKSHIKAAAHHRTFE